MSGSTPCPLCGTLNTSADADCSMCGHSLLDARESNVGGAKCARCGSAMPSGFDFCPVCGQDQRLRWRRPVTRSLRLSPSRQSQEIPSGPPAQGSPSSGPTPFGPMLEAPPSIMGGPLPSSPDRTVPTPHFASPANTPANAPPGGSMGSAAPSIDRTVPSPSLGGPPPGQPIVRESVMPPVVSQTVADDDLTVPEAARNEQSIEDAAFGRGGRQPSDSASDAHPPSDALLPPINADDFEDSKTIPFVAFAQQGDAGKTIPAMFISRPPGSRPVVDATRPDRPGGFSGGPTGEAPPRGVNIAKRTLAPVAEEVPSRLPTYPGNQPARLVLVARDGTEGESFPFSGQMLTVGRTHGDILFPEDPFLSPVHVRLSRTGDGFLLTDTGSTNGVYMRIAKVAPVYPGDMFMIGHQLLRLDQLDSQAQEHPPGADGTRLFGTPLQPAWGRITQIGRGGVAGDHLYLRGSRVSFGREGGDLVFPNDPFVSREHARLRLEITGQAMSVHLEDLGSANGTYVRIRGAAQIRDGDTFRVGDQILKLRVDL